MSTGRLLGLLVGGIAVIALALWLTSRTPQSGGDDVGRPVLPGLTGALNSITEVRLAKGDGTHTTLHKDTSDWIVSERGFPADSGRVRKLLIDISQLQVVEDKTRDPAHYAQIGVEDVSSPQATGTRVELVMPGRTETLIVGKPAGAKSSYVRVAKDPQSWLASPQLSVDADPRRWLDNTVIDLADSRIKEVALTPASGPAYTISRMSAQQPDFTVSPLPKHRELTSASAATPIAGALASLTLDDVHRIAGTTAAASAPGSGGKPESVFRTFNGLTVTLTGRQDGDHRFIRISAQSSTPETQSEARELARFADWELEIPGYKYDSIFRPLEDLLKKPETPAKGAAAKGKPAKGRALPSSPVPAGSP